MSSASANSTRGVWPTLRVKLTAETGSEWAGNVFKHLPVFTSHILTLSSNWKGKGKKQNKHESPFSQREKKQKTPRRLTSAFHLLATPLEWKALYSPIPTRWGWTGDWSCSRRRSCCDLLEFSSTFPGWQKKNKTAGMSRFRQRRRCFSLKVTFGFALRRVTAAFVALGFEHQKETANTRDTVSVQPVAPSNHVLPFIHSCQLLRGNVLNVLKCSRWNRAFWRRGNNLFFL